MCLLGMMEDSFGVFLLLLKKRNIFSWNTYDFFYSEKGYIRQPFQNV